MYANSKRNEHPRCGCKSCRRGSGDGWGQFVHRQVNRRIRHKYNALLHALRTPEEVDFIVVSTTYTD